MVKIVLLNLLLFSISSSSGYGTPKKTSLIKIEKLKVVFPQQEEQKKVVRQQQVKAALRYNKCERQQTILRQQQRIRIQHEVLAAQQRQAEAAQRKSTN